MRIVLSRHALERIESRKLHAEWVRETVRHPDKIERLGGGKYLARRKINGLTLEAVCVRRTFIKVVTVYPV